MYILPSPKRPSHPTPVGRQRAPALGSLLHKANSHQLEDSALKNIQHLEIVIKYTQHKTCHFKLFLSLQLCGFKYTHSIVQVSVYPRPSSHWSALLTEP